MHNLQSSVNISNTIHMTPPASVSGCNFFTESDAEFENCYCYFHLIRSKSVESMFHTLQHLLVMVHRFTAITI